jgi:hypothetical protein
MTLMSCRLYIDKAFNKLLLEGLKKRGVIEEKTWFDNGIAGRGSGYVRDHKSQLYPL